MTDEANIPAERLPPLHALRSLVRRVGPSDLSTLLWNTRLTVTVKNLTNTRYREPMSFIAEPGRSVLLSMRRELALPL